MQSFTLYILRLPNKCLILKWPLIPNFFFKVSFSTAINPENIHKLFIFCFFNQVVFSRNLKIQLQPTCCRVSVVRQIICILTMVMEVHCCFLGHGIVPWWKIKYNQGGSLADPMILIILI